MFNDNYVTIDIRDKMWTRIKDVYILGFLLESIAIEKNILESDNSRKGSF